MKKSYYTIDIEIDRKIMGNCYPQIETIKPIDIAESLSSWYFPENNILFEITLHKNALMTDILSNFQTNSSGLIVSKRLKDILDNFKLMEHKYYPVSIKDRNEIYYWLHLSDMQLSYDLDYNHSSFNQTKYNSIQNEILLSSFSEYELLKKMHGASFGVRLKETKLHTDDLKKLDLLKFIPFTGVNLFISEDLKLALEENKIKGVNFQKTEIIKIS